MLSYLVDEGGVFADDDDGWEPTKLVTGPCVSDSGYWQILAQNSVYVDQPCPQQDGGQFLPYTSHIRGGKDQDGQRGQIIGPSWVPYLLAFYSCTEQGFTKCRWI